MRVIEFKQDKTTLTVIESKRWLRAVGAEFLAALKGREFQAAELRSFQILVEPSDRLFQSTDLVLGFDEHVTLARINDQLRWYPEGF